MFQNKAELDGSWVLTEECSFSWDLGKGWGGVGMGVDELRWKIRSVWDQI